MAPARRRSGSPPTSRSPRPSSPGRRSSTSARRWRRPSRARPGYAEWEVRLDLRDHREAVALAEQLESEGIPVTRRWTYLLVGAASSDDANELADRLRAEGPEGMKVQVQPGGEMVWEAAPRRSKIFYFIPNL